MLSVAVVHVCRTVLMLLMLMLMLQASNEALAAEKTRMDVLLARQYNLIGCMAEEGASSRNGKTATSLEEKTLGGCCVCVCDTLPPQHAAQA